MEWIPFDEFKVHIPDSTQPSVTKYLRKNHEEVVKKLYEQYATGKDWLLVQTHSKKDFTYRGTSEIDYILFWAWKKKVYLDSRLRESLYDYLMENYTEKSKIIKRWVRHHHNLITDEEWEIIQSINNTSKAIIKGVVFLTLFLMKPLRELTDEDLDLFPMVYTIEVGNKFSKKTLNDLRMRLGYTNKIVRSIRGNNWEKKLFKHPLWGEMFREYHDYLIRGQAKKKLVGSIGGCLCTLMDYLNKKSLTSCAHFDFNDYKEFTEYLFETREVSSVSTMIGKYKKFFLWGCNSNDFFPRELYFPDTYWKSVNVAAKKHAANSNGLAFENETLAEGIVKVLKEFKPTNEIEQLCLYFWLIIVSCPARFGFILNLQAEDTLQPFPNKSKAYGIFSLNADKAGNKNAQFPFVDKMGIDALIALQARARILKFKPLYNDRHRRSYVHLFQLPEPPWVLTKDTLWDFFNHQIKPRVASVMGLKDSKFKGGAHGFRHYILTEIFKRTGSMEAVRVGAGHTEKTMSKNYLKSIHAKKALLFRALDKFEKGEITGKFYLRLIEALTTDEPTTELMKDLTRDLTMDEYIKKHGRRTQMGYCFDENGTCGHYLKCWSCPSFMMTREEIEGAIELLRQLISDFIKFKNESNDFTYESMITKNKLTSIALIKERLSDLKIPEEEILDMIFD